MASLSLSPAERASIEAFRRDVVEPSMNGTLVLVDFWAEWCGPCKTLGPVLEKVTAEYKGRVKLVKIDTDKEQLLAQQFRIQSIPTVFAFLRGQPVDGFAGARSEREVRAFIDRLIATLPPTEEELDLDQLVEAANQALAEGDAQAAAEMFGAIVQEAPDRLDAVAGYARALLALGQVEGAEQALAMVPADAKDPAVAQARAALALAREAGPAGETAELERAVAADPDAHDKRFELAGALMAVGDNDGAAAQLLEIIRRDRGWNEGAARDRLLKLFEAVGHDSPWTAQQRRRLSTILFS